MNPRRWRRFTISNDEVGFEPGGLHLDDDCLADDPDGCDICIEEMDEASDVLMRRLENDRIETWDVWLVEKPGRGIGDDEFWTFDLLVSKPPEI